jgi:hypothetical protein
VNFDRQGGQGHVYDALSTLRVKDFEVVSRNFFFVLIDAFGIETI